MGRQPFFMPKNLYSVIYLPHNNLLMLHAKNIQKSFGKLQVLNGIDLQIAKGEIVSIVGSSGAGKSTLLQILGTLDQPDVGTVYLKDTDVFKLKSSDLASFRNKEIGFIFQFHNLLPEFTAFENICIPAFIQGKNGQKLDRQVLDLMKILNIADRKDHKPSQLSGGEQQRVAVARALVNQPSIIFADEPSGNLDSKNAEELHQLFFKLQKDLNQTFVIVTHNKALADMADRKVVLQDGKILS